eukprot:CAMPEP_0117023374 /NCGR_PEP_ID=MMETSP0472-20121206/17455_1 /TAXON_ID=693140 ORGANISM="Tiarina fusus, Strain LIS" /NCGR_SAMPLE_ID=MMETSP0472 /ASSEMBLY_ACC=CAM_ASM_000603 /LENGTH=212 /DNA_ID=CAMNT_0004729481 /DNA_START=19 /DNA_END=657 /DNA_ORIENTATION=-
MADDKVAKFLKTNNGPVRIVIAGMIGVGKSCLLKTLAEGEFPNDSDLPTIEESFTCTIQVQGHPVELFLQDTMGQEAFRKITQSFYQGCQAIVICYDVSKKESFTSVPEWMGEIKQYCLTDKTKRVPIVLVGNKCDIVEGKLVTFGEGEKFAKENKIQFFETSAKQGVHVEDPFESIVEQLAEGFVFEKKDPLAMMEAKGAAPAKKKGCTLL